MPARHPPLPSNMNTATNPSTELATLNTALQQAEELDQFVAENSATTLLAGDAGPFTISIRMSAAMKQLRSMITKEMMAPIMEMQGSPLGFRTDKDKEGGYKEDIVKEVLIEATLKGFRMVNNETNIIGTRFYPTREGFERVFRDLGKTGTFTDLRLYPGVPRTQADGAIVDYAATWIFKGMKDDMKLSIPIRVNAGQGPDAVLGKAKRKMLAAIFGRITGSEFTDGDETEDPNTMDVTAKPVPEKAVPLPPDLLTALEAKVGPHEALANPYFAAKGFILEGQTFRDVSEAMARRTLKNIPGFLATIGAKS